MIQTGVGDTDGRQFVDERRYQDVRREPDGRRYRTGDIYAVIFDTYSYCPWSTIFLKTDTIPYPYKKDILYTILRTLTVVLKVFFYL